MTPTRCPVCGCDGKILTLKYTVLFKCGGIHHAGVAAGLGCTYGPILEFQEEDLCHSRKPSFSSGSSSEPSSGLK